MHKREGTLTWPLFFSCIKEGWGYHRPLEQWQVLYICVKFHLFLKHQNFFKPPQSPHSCALRAQQFDNKSHSVRMGAQHQLCICYSSIINQAESFHVPMLFPGMLITWIPCDLCHNSRHIKCPVKYVHTYDQTRNFFLSIFLKGCQPTENWHVTFMAMKAVLGCLDFWLSLPFSMFSVTTCLCRSKCMYVFHSMLCTTCLAQKCYF